MALRIEKSFVVHAGRDDVWSFLTDPYRVASCLPGAAITERLDDRSYGGTISVKVGPVNASYKGKLRFERLDAAGGEAEIVASGQETRGKGAADMRMQSRVMARGADETEVVVVSEVNVMGVLAQFGRGMIQDVSDQMFEKFSGAMRRQLESPAPLRAHPSLADTAGAAPAPDGRDRAEAPAATAAPAAAGPAPAARTPATGAASAHGEIPAAPPGARDEVLDLGSIGAAAAGRTVLRLARSPVLWIAIAVLAALCWFALG